MIGVFVVLSLGGNWLDKHFSMHFPAFTLAGVVLALISVFYFIFKLIRNQD
ncbi:MAG: AtpZ/AtpI family protein [Bacteroidia bacterium]|nr:AtpZ/AtpI family protein [Bacteroidia bacterium]